MQLNIRNIFKLILKEIFNLPFWIKQIIYIKLKEEFDSLPVKNYINNTNKENCLQLYLPKLTFTGKKELEKKSGNLNSEIYNFLEAAYQDLNIIETAIANNWNLSECSKYFIQAINLDLISNPSSNAIKGTALYMAGEIRLGEFFVKINKINIEQLNESLKTQKHTEETYGDRPGLADIMVQLGFLEKEDTAGILLLKEDCLKRYKSDILNETTTSC